MKRMVLGAVVSLVAGACAADEVDTTSSEAAVSKRWLVVMRTESLPNDATTKIKRAGATLLRSLPNAGLALIGATEEQANKLAADPAFLAIGLERFTRLETGETKPVEQPTDDFLPLQWDMRRIGAPALWGRAVPTTTVAVIDTGVMYDHIEFAYDNTVVYRKTTSHCRPSDAPAWAEGYPVFWGIADETAWTSQGPTCVPLGESPIFVDPAFHGTHVAGTIAAPANGIGIVGVSPTTKIAAYNVFDVGWDGTGFFLGGYDWAILAAIEDAAAHKFGVVNMSLGGQLDRRTREGNAAFVAWQRVAARAFRNGTLVVAAAGNSAANNNGSIAFIPSDLPSVMSVSATGVTDFVGEPTLHFNDEGWLTSIDEFNGVAGGDVLTFYSNFGAAVDVAAPGGDYGENPNWESWDPAVHQILSPCPAWDGVGIDPYSYCWAMGTSMAAPHVAGVAAAVRALHPTWTPGQTRDWLKSTATPVGDRQGFGAGIVNADLATR